MECPFAQALGAKLCLHSSHHHLSFVCFPGKEGISFSLKVKEAPALCIGWTLLGYYEDES
jgi:hypothetical protein